MTDETKISEQNTEQTNPLYASRKKKRARTIIVLVIIVALVAGLVGWRVLKAKQDAAATDNGLPEGATVETVERRTIVNSVSGTGTVVSKNSEEVTSVATGLEILSVLAEVGDEVHEGQLLMTLDASDLIEQRSDLSERIASTLEDQAEYHEDYDESKKDQIESREERIKNTKENLDDATADYNQAVLELHHTQSEYNELIKSGSTRDTTEATQMQMLIDSEKQTVSTLKTRVDTLQDTLDELEEDELDFTDSDKSMREYDDNVSDTIESLNDQIESLTERIDDAQVYATMSGTVTAVNVEAGDTYSGQTAFLIEGVDVFVVEAEIEEYDIPDIVKGQKVLMKTDATKDEELEGTVSFVAPKASGGMLDGAGLGDMSSLLGGYTSGSGDLSSLMGSGSSAATYLVRISMESFNERLRLGMNAKISIITDESKDALAVPYEAVLEREDDGSTYIQVIDEKKTTTDEDGNEIYVLKDVDVKTGIEGTYYIEILDGDIKEGMRISVPSATGEDTVDDLLNMIGSGVGV